MSKYKVTFCDIQTQIWVRTHTYNIIYEKITMCDLDINLLLQVNWKKPMIF